MNRELDMDSKIQQLLLLFIILSQISFCKDYATITSTFRCRFSILSMAILGGSLVQNVFNHTEITGQDILHYVSYRFLIQSYILGRLLPEGSPAR